MVWSGGSVDEVSSFSECVEHLWTDSGLGDALERSEGVYSPLIDEGFRELDEVLTRINGHSRRPSEVLDDPGMERARQLARSLLEDVRRLG